jgi:hypothetical protein
MNCPNCQKKMPDEQAWIRCPTCGGVLPKIACTVKESGVLLGRVLLAIFLGLVVLAGTALAIMAVIYAGCVLSNGGRL